ncbi:hypothetical protein AAF712_002498 [Marasmius tenuissimus]|uniref:Uncharacterized protein n=1 Tax=Marasmius tenuissimus TaxID=585030 RepID=A0ABR3AAW8_9AGAR
MNVSDRARDYHFLHARGSQNCHALLRMRDEEVRWTASMAAQSQGWVTLDASKDHLGKRKDREDEEGVKEQRTYKCR